MGTAIAGKSDFCDASTPLIDGMCAAQKTACEAVESCHSTCAGCMTKEKVATCDTENANLPPIFTTEPPNIQMAAEGVLVLAKVEEMWNANCPVIQCPLCMLNNAKME